MAFEMILGNGLRAKESVKVGRFVLDVEDLHQGHFDPTEPQPSIISKIHENVEELFDADNNKSYAAELTRIFSLAFKKRNNVRINIRTGKVVTYQLDNWKKWFADTVAMEPVREWINKRIETGEPIYLILGYSTLLDASVRQLAESGNEVDAKAQVPFEAVAMTAGFTPVVDVGNPGVAASHQHGQSERARFVAPGEQVCAIKYGKLKWKWYASKDLDQASINSTRWKFYLDHRGPADEDVEDVVGVFVEDWAEDEIDLEGEWETAVFNDGQHRFVY
ncbi:hypothetical protein H2201_009034 [Coniosporium apollinis]|uniref:Uncharacterized protein n=2 Tax=Coniosporium TaxID=2810619 RepID=A0ABQ9NFI7_9PEZI|nr:hypothetical protein H2199_009059 [Cladosporium sp. JES 115]KAJ9654216.1 hypothetical protein H2201_009034 [Coniosporium apollinis]